MLRFKVVSVTVLFAGVCFWVYLIAGGVHFLALPMKDVMSVRFVVKNQASMVEGSSQLFVFWKNGDDRLGSRAFFKLDTAGRKGLLEGVRIIASENLKVNTVDLDVEPSDHTEHEPRNLDDKKSPIIEYTSEGYIIRGKWSITPNADSNEGVTKVIVEFPAVSQTRDKLEAVGPINEIEIPLEVRVITKDHAIAESYRYLFGGGLFVLLVMYATIAGIWGVCWACEWSNVWLGVRLGGGLMYNLAYRFVLLATIAVVGLVVLSGVGICLIREAPYVEASRFLWSEQPSGASFTVFLLNVVAAGTCVGLGSTRWSKDWMAGVLPGFMLLLALTIGSFLFTKEQLALAQIRDALAQVSLCLLPGSFAASLLVFVKHTAFHKMG